MKELKRLSEQMSGRKSKRNDDDDSDGGADPKIKDLGRERRKQKRTQITNEELLQRLKKLKRISVLFKKMITLMNRSHV